MTVENSMEFSLPSSPADKKVILDAFAEIGDSWIRTSAERDFVKDAITALSEKFDIPGKVLRKMAKIHYLANIDQVEYEQDAIVQAYRVVTGKLGDAE